VAALIGALLLAPRAAFSQPPAYPVYWYKTESSFLYGAMGAHGDVWADFSWTRASVGLGFDGLPADAAWSHPLTVDQFENGSGDDAVTIKGTLGHVIAPHGEPANPSTFHYRWEVDAGDFPLGAGPGGVSGYQWVREYRGQLGHAAHADEFWAGNGVWVWDGPSSGNDLLAYLWMVIAHHTSGQAPAAYMGGGPMFGAPNAVGGGMVGVVCDPMTLDGILGIQIGGVPQQDIVASHIHYMDGATPQVLDLGPQNLWATMSNDAPSTNPPTHPVRGRFLNGSLPLALLQSMQAGTAYADVHLASSPTPIAGPLPASLVGVGEEFPSPGMRLSLSANPSRGPLTLRFSIPETGPVNLRIYDVRGASVRRLVDAALPAGPREVVWDGRDDRGLAAPAGMYFVRLRAGSRVEHARLVRLN
jgi:hypothetical protein